MKNTSREVVFGALIAATLTFGPLISSAPAVPPGAPQQGAISFSASRSMQRVAACEAHLAASLRDIRDAALTRALDAYGEAIARLKQL